MKNLLFTFADIGSAKDKTINAITKAFARYGVQVVSSEADPKTAKRSGVAFRTVGLTFADGQTVAFAVKESGDVFEVRINGKVQPLREQDDHARAVAEIAGWLDRKRAAFQAALTKIKTPIPPALRATRKTRMAAKVAKRDGLREAVQLKTQELAELTGEAQLPPSE